jgi:hypothetical protein
VIETKVRRVFRLRHAGASRADVTATPAFSARDGLVQGSHQPVAHWLDRLNAAVENELGLDLLVPQQRTLLVGAMTEVTRAAGDPTTLVPALTRLVRAAAAIGRSGGPVTEFAFQAVRALHTDRPLP